MRYGATTTATPPDVLRMARETFGPSGHDLRLAHQDLTTARFDSAAGFVSIEARRGPNRMTEVVIETREFDAEARRFVEALPRRSLFGAMLAKIRGKHRPSVAP